MLEQTVGILVLTLPILIFGYFLLRQSLPVYWFLVALVLVGTGYLVTTGGASDIGRATLRGLGGGMAMVPSFGG